ncbi:putative aminodeoxychorismate lyase [Streptococcus oralis]|nr:putative aminodeoxychorismate lyase [Streptococcus oralis]
MIAGVFYNRLNAGMPLQSNIAILYAQGKLGQKISLADDAGIDTTIDSPYNVYTHLGLMPGPVDSPSSDAIEASVNQTKSEYLYFVANVEDGKVYFATTKEEHDQNVAEHINSKLPQASSSN